MRYWVISGNPSDGPAFEYFQDAKNFRQWSVSAHKEDMRVGDKIAFWMTGPDRGFYFFAEISKAPYSGTHWREEQKKKKMKGLYIDLRKQRSVHTNPILRTDLGKKAEVMV
jgi:hypothetical protein